MVGRLDSDLLPVAAGTGSQCLQRSFLTHATLGFQFFNNQRRAFTAGVRYEHISNAGLTVPNPGINTVQFQIGLNWFK